MPRRKTMKKPPEFGYVEFGFLEANEFGPLLEVSETIQAKRGEGQEEFLARLLKTGHPGDKVRIVYKRSKPQFANVTRGAYDMTPAAPAPAGSPVGKMSSWEESWWRLFFRSPKETP